MNARHEFDKYIGVGLYTVADAAALMRVPARNIQRWVEGYDYKGRDGQQRHSDSVVHPDLEKAGDLPTTLTFQELMEVRLVHSFRHFGVSWKAIRKAAERAAEQFGTRHPFAMTRFRTDGREIFADLKSREQAVLRLTKNQMAFEDVVSPSFLSGVEYSVEGAPEQWWPLGKDRRVLLDPGRSFGKPIDPVSGIPIETLLLALRVELTPEAVADFYEVDVQAVTDAIEFAKEYDLRLGK